MLDFEGKIKNKFGSHCFVIDVYKDINRALISDGEYEYLVSTGRQIWANNLCFEMLTCESRIKLYQKQLPKEFLLIDILKDEEKHYPVFLFNYIPTNCLYEFPYTRGMENFVGRFERSLRTKKSNWSCHEIVKHKYGETFRYLRMDENNKNNFIITDGQYEWSVDSIPYKDKAGLSIKSMTKQSLIKYWNNKFVEHLTVIDFVRKNGNRYLIVKDIRSDEEFDCEYGRSITDQSNRINRIYQHRLDFFKKCNIKYGDKFLFDKTKYSRADVDVIITCPIHGDFTTTPHSFLRSTAYGCPECGNEARYGFSKSAFIGACKNGEGSLYVIRCFNENEEFLKIGVTAHKTLKRRFTCTPVMPYRYEEILIINKNPELIFNLEHEIHRTFRNNKHVPLLKFNGHTECFDISIKDSAISFIEKLLLSS